MDVASNLPRVSGAIALAVFVTACSGVGGIDAADGSTMSNNEAYAAVGYLWSGARNAIESEREPFTDTFNLQLNYQRACLRGGQRAYQGSLTGRKASGTGTATLTLTGTLMQCTFDDRSTITTVAASGLTVTGTIAVTNDAWATINLKMASPSVTVNDKACPGGVDVTLTGASPSAQPNATGTVCGRTGSVLLP